MLYVVCCWFNPNNIIVYCCGVFAAEFFSLPQLPSWWFVHGLLVWRMTMFTHVSYVSSFLCYINIELCRIYSGIPPYPSHALEAKPSPSFPFFLSFPSSFSPLFPVVVHCATQWRSPITLSLLLLLSPSPS